MPITLNTCRRCIGLFSLIAVIALIIVLSANPLPAEQGVQLEEDMAKKYSQLEQKLLHSPLGLPVYLESSADNETSEAKVDGIIDFPFDMFRQELLALPNWCDIVILHTNIRACTYSLSTKNPVLTLYNVNKHSQPLADASKLFFAYHLKISAPSYFEVVMTADKGPFGTRDHDLMLKAVPIDGNRTFVHLNYSYHYGPLQYLAMTGYFALSAKRVGFTVTGKDENNIPLYTAGARGAIERNVMRYYLAFVAYFDSLRFPAAERYEKRITLWYDLSARYKKQFPEIEKKEYLTHKRLDLKNQIFLQAGHTDLVK
jgi:hypothetical protein